MFFKSKNESKNEEHPVICEQYDNKLLALYHDKDVMRGWAQAVKWYSLPLEILLEDSAEYNAVLKEVHNAKLNLRNAIAAYDTACYEFKKWVEIHSDELPLSYQIKINFDDSIESIRYALHDITANNSYFYFDHYIKK